MKVTRLTILLSALLCLGSCSPQQVITWVVRGGASAAERGFDKMRLQQSFLYESTNLFYPNGVPSNPDILPDLSEAQVRGPNGIQQRLDDRLTALRSYVGRNSKLLGDVFGQRIAVPEGFRLVVSDTRLPQAYNTNGVITLDVKVVQAIYRGLLIDALSSEGSTKEQEAESLRAFFTLKQKVAEQSTLTSVEQFRSLAESLRTSQSIPDAVFGAVTAAVEADAMRGALSGISSGYDETLDFLIAHELGHTLLNHEDLRTRMTKSEQVAFVPVKEYAADRLAVTLALLMGNEKLTPLTLSRHQALGPDPLLNPNVGPTMFYQEGGIWYANQGAFGCPTEILNSASGHRVFFRRAYDIAGFDTQRRADEPYPTALDRLEHSNLVYRAVLAALSDAQRMSSTCAVSEETRDRYKADPEAAVRVFWERKHSEPKDDQLCRSPNSRERTCRIKTPRDADSADAGSDYSLTVPIFIHYFKAMTSSTWW